MKNGKRNRDQKKTTILLRCGDPKVKNVAQGDKNSLAYHADRVAAHRGLKPIGVKVSRKIKKSKVLAVLKMIKKLLTSTDWPEL